MMSKGSYGSSYDACRVSEGSYVLCMMLTGCLKGLVFFVWVTSTLEELYRAIYLY